MSTSTDPAAVIDQLRSAMPEEGMFRDKEWVLSPEAFPLETELVSKLERLGNATLAFQQACNRLYLSSAAAEVYPWVAPLLDRGKPDWIIALGRQQRWRDDVPRVIRPDLILAEDGVSIAELDSLPGGIGLTAWLGRMYSSLGSEIVGGADGMLEGFSSAYPGHDFLISKESGDYQPEMEWLCAQLNEKEGADRRVFNPWDTEPHELAGRDIYRFFELWDLDNVEQGRTLTKMAERGELHFTPPLKAYLEEKLWLALFWSPALREWWRKELSAEDHQLLEECIPYGWVMDDISLPWHAEWPELGIHSWQEMKRFGGKERELVLKVSGFSETAWGSRGVSIGHDLSQDAWSSAIDEALAAAPHHPHVLQRFTRARVISHPAWNEAKQTAEQMRGRVRLCPYYFVHDGSAHLSGALATIVPADKKILHGMRDAMLLPCQFRA